MACLLPGTISLLFVNSTIAFLSLTCQQSDSAGVKIPEVDLELASGTLGGMVTTVEGLVTKIGESEYSCTVTYSFKLQYL
ncbi:Zinc finger protein ZPR1-like protein [Bienertia sinuspersici]